MMDNFDKMVDINLQAIKQDPKRMKATFSEAIKVRYLDFGWPVDEICSDLKLPEAFVEEVLKDFGANDVSRTEKGAN